MSFGWSLLGVISKSKSLGNEPSIEDN
uniref:Uncharacterized protein n=1 Tax=Rhizophora mucronata TaxID=61149 RepID=A0A2P2PZT9_RHIMU